MSARQNRKFSSVYVVHSMTSHFNGRIYLKIETFIEEVKRSSLKDKYYDFDCMQISPMQYRIQIDDVAEKRYFGSYRLKNRNENVYQKYISHKFTIIKQKIR